MTTIKNFLTDNKNLMYNDLKGKLKNINLSIKELDNLFLLNYKEDYKKDIASNILLDKNLIDECRSIIIDKNNYEIKMLGLIGSIKFEEFIKNVSWNDLVVEESIDGTLINLYYNNNEWNVSTKKTLNGECYWNTKRSFKELFLETINKLNLNFNILNNKNCYSFVLCHPEARNVTLYDHPKLYHICTRDLNTLKEIDEDIGIIKPNILKLDDYNILENNCNSYDDLLKNLNLLNYTKEGYMLFSKNRKYRTKLRGKNHLEIKALKGEYCNMKLRILEIRKDNNMNLFLENFSEYFEDIKNIETSIDNLAKKILYFYTLINIKKERRELPLFIKKPLYCVHNIYLNNINEEIPCKNILDNTLNIKYNKTQLNLKKKKYNIQLSDIIKWLNDQEPKYLCYLLNNEESCNLPR
tara:strand:+ start:2100 stop:3332 length:1233 start_codon:yes stop_codon:yes gene_type:complete